MYIKSQAERLHVGSENMDRRVLENLGRIGVDVDVHVVTATCAHVTSMDIPSRHVCRQMGPWKALQPSRAASGNVLNLLAMS